MDGKEVELKLALEPEGLERIKHSALVRSSKRGRPRVKQLYATYYDTPAFDLAKAGVTVRLREDGGHRLQTVKTAGSRVSGLFSRQEWEHPVATDGPDSALLRATGLAPLQDGAVVAALRPTFSTDVRRTLYRLAGDGWEVELALDLGTVGAGEARQALCEAELELKAGEPARLYTLARELTDQVPARLLALSKSERGYQLATGTPAAPVKARPVALEPNMSAAEAFQAIARNCLQHLLANEHCLLANGDPEAVHQMRVALRRLRSALKVFAEVVADPHLEEVKAELRWLLGHLGPARDADVFLAEILDPVVAAHPDLFALDSLRRHWHRQRDADFAAAVAAVAEPRFTALMLMLGAWVEGGDWVNTRSRRQAEPVQKLARRVLARLDRRLRKAGGKRLHLLPAAELHRLRILGKRLRYAGEFFASLYPKGAAKAFLARLAGLQDHLGELNDIAVAAPRLAGSVESDDHARAAELVIGWHDRRRPKLLAEAEAIWRRLRRQDRFWG